MKKSFVSASYVSTAKPADIYPLLKNSATWPMWAATEEYELVKPGRGERHGVGAQRRFRTGRNVMHEEIVELIPDQKVSYVILSDVPIKEYRADTILELLPDERTRIIWRASFHAKYWGTGWILRLLMYLVFRDFVRRLAQVAEDPKLAQEILSLSHGERTSKEEFRAFKRDNGRIRGPFTPGALSD